MKGTLLSVHAKDNEKVYFRRDAVCKGSDITMCLLYCMNSERDSFLLFAVVFDSWSGADTTSVRFC